MGSKPWQPQVLQDRLTEIGPYERDIELTKYGYLEFRTAGRIRNVTALTDLATKLKETLGTDDSVFHLIHGQHLQTGDTSSMLVAVGRQEGPIYAADMKSRGADDTARHTERARKRGKVLQYIGIGLTFLGIPLILAFIGIPMVGCGIFLWRSGKKVAAAMQYQQELLEQFSTAVARIPNVRLL